MHADTCAIASRRHFACIARGEVRYPFFFNFAFYLVDGIIYRKKNNEIRIIYHRGRSRARFAKFTFKVLHRYFPFRFLKQSRAHAKDNMLSPFRYRGLIEAASYLRPSNPEGVFLRWRYRRKSWKGCALSSSCSTLRNIMRFYLPRGSRETRSCAYTCSCTCTVILASARIPLPATQVLVLFFFSLLSLAYFSIACAMREIEREISNRNENGDIAVQWKCQ